MNLKKYCDFFHDGSVLDINFQNDKLEILMESAQLIPEWNKDNIILTNDQTIKGKLHLEKVKKILVDGFEKSKLHKIYNDGEILNFEVQKNEIFLLVEWINYEDNISLTESIKIEAEIIYWENLPNLEMS